MIKRTLLATMVVAMALLGLPGIASAQTGPSACPKGNYFIVQYNFGSGGRVIDEGCYTKNEVNKFERQPRADRQLAPRVLF